MKVRKILALALSLVLCIGMFAACTAEEKTESIVFGTNAEFPPFEFISASGVIGEFDGIDMAIADKIATDNGKTAKISNMEFDSNDRRKEYENIENAN